MLYKSPPPFHHSTLDIKNTTPLPVFHTVGGRAQSARIQEKKSTLVEKVTFLALP